MPSAMPATVDHRPEPLLAQAPEDELSKERHGSMSSARAGRSSIDWSTPIAQVHDALRRRPAPGECVARRMVRPASRFRSASSSSTRAPLSESRLPGRLVGDEQRRLVHDRAGDGRTLQLASRQLLWIVRSRCGHATRSASAARRCSSTMDPARPASAAAARCSRASVSVGSRLKNWNTKPIRSRRIRVRASSSSVSSRTAFEVTDPPSDDPCRRRDAATSTCRSPDGPTSATKSAALDRQADVAHGVHRGVARQVGLLQLIGDEERHSNVTNVSTCAVFGKRSKASR